jgi:lipoprotein-releasing system permease protein
MVVVVLGIASVLVVSVVQKQREIGILRAMGATRARCMRVFLLQGASSARWARCWACCWRWLLIWAVHRFVRGSDGLPLFNITLAPGLALRIACWPPVRRAGRGGAGTARGALDPAQAIRL